ncbi:hypothetical protein [Solilutibacter silvestris]|uniref:hypothetical protein n=1 Tax=Solilutibacter silvestris TaxID=1645665 RepID=UPI003D3497A5
MTALAKPKKRTKRAQRPIYFTVRKLVDPETGESLGCLVPDHPVDRRLMRDRGFHVNREIRAQLEEPRNGQFHRLAHAIGALVADNVEKFQGKDSHEVLKKLQEESGVCCDVEKFVIDLGQYGRHEVDRLVPRSIAFDQMKEDQFRQFFDGITAWVGEHYAHVMLDDIRAEFWLMVNGEQA